MERNYELIDSKISIYFHIDTEKWGIGIEIRKDGKWQVIDIIVLCFKIGVWW